MTIGKRIAEIRKFLELNQTQLASIMETVQNNVSLIENGRLVPSEKYKENLVLKLHVNRTWLETGDGEMFSLSGIPESYLTREQMDKIVENTRPSSTAVPFYENPIEGFADGSDSRVPRYMIDYPPFNDCTFYRPVYGESMTPKFKKGDTIACKRLANKDSLMYGEIYLCTFRRGDEIVELLRSIRRTDDPGIVSLVPLNPEYDSINIPKSSIEALYIVKGRIERFV